MSKIEIRRSEDRGRAEHGWLSSRHSFSFADYYDLKHMGFGALRVINEDWVQPGQGFPMHFHNDMEIVTIILEGALEHQDSQGNRGVIRPGDIQRMTAGSGIRHSEFNASKTEIVHLLQIWIYPNQKSLTPGYEQKTFSLASLQNHFQPLVSGEKKSDTVFFNQDAYFSRGVFEEGRTVSYAFQKPDHGLYLLVISGEIFVQGETLRHGDALSVASVNHLDFRAVQKADLLAIEVPLLRTPK